MTQRAIGVPIVPSPTKPTRGDSVTVSSLRAQTLPSVPTDLMAIRSAARSKPNILVLMVDELNVRYTEMYGHPFVRTPHLAALAAAGVTVERAYCNSPLCVPSRAAFMTGRLPHRVGVYDLASSLSSEEPTWA